MQKEDRMRISARWTFSVIVTLTLGAGFLSRLGAADEKDIKGTVLKIADALEKNDAAGAKKLAESLKDEDLEDVMHLFKPRKDKGLGIGAKAGAVKPDGIELKVIALAMNEPPKKELDDAAADLARAGYVAAAIAEVALIKSPEKKEKDKDPKDWKNWAEGMQQGALELASAAKAKKAADVKKAAEKMDNNCKSCHKVFRDE
jgi:soluble cytochrome b562